MMLVNSLLEDQERDSMILISSIRTYRRIEYLKYLKRIIVLMVIK